MNNKEELLKKDKKIKKLAKLRKIIDPIAIVLCVSIVIITFLLFAIKEKIYILAFLLLAIPVAFVPVIVQVMYNSTFESLYSELHSKVLSDLGLSNWEFISNGDVVVRLKSKQAVENYTDIKFFKEYPNNLPIAIDIAKRKQEYHKKLYNFLKNNEYKDNFVYYKIEEIIKRNLLFADTYRLIIDYTSPAHKSNYQRVLPISLSRLEKLMSDETLFMTQSELNKYLKEKSKAMLENKQRAYYDRVNKIIDFANDNKNNIIIRGSNDLLEKQISLLFDRTVNSIKKIKTISSEEWDLIDSYIKNSEENVNEIINNNLKIVNYYNSSDFLKIKESCSNLMNTQKEFNEYIDEKVKDLSKLFGTNIIREETEIEDEYNYIHQYKKTISPFVAEVSQAVFASAENNPLKYIISTFYPDKTRYPEQIQKLHLLVEELETLKDAKQIIDNYKKEVQQYLGEVPSFIMENDEDGFYSKLGFATINEKTLTVEYRFTYTSPGGKAQRSFPVPMTEETIVSLIKALESKLTMSAFSKEQRSLMTSKLRQSIKERDNFTCKICENSTYKEPNLLLEIDHIIPVSKGGCTEESNLQTLCWKCNRQKSSKIL